MCSDLSLSRAQDAATAMPLALPYGDSRPVFTESPWWNHAPTRADAGIAIHPAHARCEGAIINFHPSHSERVDVPAHLRHLASIDVITCPDWVWDDDEDGDPPVEQFGLYMTSLLFADRAGCRRAYRAARQIAAGRSAFRTIHEGAGFLHAVIGEAHRRLASEDTLAGLIGSDAWIRFGQHPDRVRSACRVCACTEEHACSEGCFWIEPDLCSECIGREPHGPNEGFAGFCDWCGRASQRLRLRGTSQMAECPRCRRGTDELSEMETAAGWHDEGRAV